MFAARNMTFAYPVAAAGFTLGWETPMAVSTFGDGIVSTSGTLIEAKNLGEATNRTVNGVLFTGQSTRDGLTNAFSDGSVYQDGVIGAAFEGMMDSFAWGGSPQTITLTGLTSGKTYLFQGFVSDDRSFGATNKLYYVIQSYTSDELLENSSSSYICRFVATGTTETVTMPLTTGGFCITNGFQVRQLD